ncbi:class I SAM-dependent methyltransferase [Pseudomonas purpurea]|uniref:class I SAM-dependent methyltransferase n=1 Tax=Pseudomonas purpurea TaxID=3136737 RepID=UPI00326722F7
MDKDKDNQVIGMYEAYPYPTFGNHNDYAGTFLIPAIRSKAIKGRALEVGCGTGCVTVDWAEQCPELEILAFDRSQNSIRYARDLKVSREVANLTFEQRDLNEDNPDLKGFDFVYCHGVLHHLHDIQAGLNKLFNFVRPGGYCYLWTYASLGRRELHDLREMLTHLAIDASHPDRLKLIEDLIPAHFRPLVYGEEKTEQEKLINLHDVVYHPRDGDFRVEELYGLVEQAGFNFIQIFEANGAPWPAPSALAWSKTLIERCEHLPRRQQDTLLELFLKPAGIGFMIQRPE